MTYLVTGTAGFIGTNLALELERRGLPWTGIDYRRPAVSAVQKKTRIVDLRDQEETLRVVAEIRPSAVIHLAARTDLDGRNLRDYDSNTGAVLSLVRALHEMSPQPYLVHASSRLVFDPSATPINDWDYSADTWYGESKVAGELIVRSMDPENWTIVRPTSIWGPYFGVPYRGFFEAVMARRYLHATGHRVAKTMGYVGNTVDQLIAVTKHQLEASARVFMMGDSEPVVLDEWARMIAQMAHIPPPRYVPMRLLQAGAAAGTVIQRVSGRPMPITNFRLQNIYESVTYDTTPIARLAEERYSVEQGVRETIAWLRGYDALARA